MSRTSLMMKKRLLTVLLILFIVVSLLMVRVAYIQIAQGPSLQNMAYEQQNRSRVLNPKRGTIYDRNGVPLATSASVETVTISPSNVRNTCSDTGLVASRLAEILDLDAEVIQSKIMSKTMYQILKKKISRETGDLVRKFALEQGIDGIYVDEDSQRYYPERNLAAHIIGFTGTDNQGLSGIEMTFDQYLKGSPGRILSEVDAGGRELPSGNEKRVEAQDGLDLVLTIDENIQYFTQKVLEKAIEDYNVTRGAAAIIMDPRNGDILAMVSKPDFDLNAPYAAPLGVDPTAWKGNTKEDVELLSKTVWRNKAVMDTYEPGSTFKAITSAAGLEEGVIHPEDRVNDFPVQIGKWKLKCWRNYNLHGEESFREGVYNSCNPVFVRIAQDLGIDRFYKYVRDFGFFDKTGIPLSGEQKAIFQQKPVEIDMCVASFGQRFQITPIQLITAYCAIANGGNLMKPRLVKEIRDQEGNVVKSFEPEVVRRVISAETSATLRDILQGVVAEGTGKNAYIKGYRIAGKTGTSQTTSADRYIASFSAFAPADNPQICALVVLDDPDGISHMGGAVAAPVAGKLIEDVLDYLQEEKVYTEKEKESLVSEVFVPEVRELTVEEAEKRLKQRGLKYRVEGGGDKNSLVKQQLPKPEASISENSVIILYTGNAQQESTVSMPNILGMTVEEATRVLNGAGLNIKVVGDGKAVKQAFAEGEKVGKGTVVEVEFRYLENIE